MRTVEETLAAIQLPLVWKNGQQVRMVPRPDQLDDVRQQQSWPRAGNYSEVGTGKTLTATLLALCYQADLNIVVMPPILIRQWAVWLRSIQGAGSVEIYTGTPAQRKNLNIYACDWLLMSLGVFKNDFDRLKKAVDSVKGAKVTLLVDEGHSCKNIESKNFQKVRDFSEGHNLIIMTGTPLTTPEDAYAYCKLISPETYRNFQQFEALHVAERDYFDNVSKWENLDLLEKNFMLHSVRRLKQDVLKDLKEPNYIPIEYDLDKEHLQLYDQLMEEQFLLLADGGKIDATSASKLYNAAQQIVMQWSYFSGVESHRSKGFDLLDEVIEETGCLVPGNSKLIISAWFVRTNRALMEYLKTKGIKAAACYNEVSRAEQDRGIRAFMEDDSCRILQIQPASAGFGLNPQGVCWEILTLETPVVPMWFNQLVGRVYRGGQANVPNIRIGIAAGTIQRRLFDNLLRKDELVNQVQTSYKDLREAIYGDRK